MRPLTSSHADECAGQSPRADARLARHGGARHERRDDYQSEGKRTLSGHRVPHSAGDVPQQLNLHRQLPNVTGTCIRRMAPSRSVAAGDPRTSRFVTAPTLRTGSRARGRPTGFRIHATTTAAGHSRSTTTGESVHTRPGAPTRRSSGRRPRRYPSSAVNTRTPSEHCRPCARAS